MKKLTIFCDYLFLFLLCFKIVEELFSHNWDFAIWLGILLAYFYMLQTYKRIVVSYKEITDDAMKELVKSVRLNDDMVEFIKIHIKKGDGQE